MTYLSMSAALATHERVNSQFTALLRECSDGERRVPHLTWSIGETAAHVLSALTVYPLVLAGGPPAWGSLAAGEAENARLIASIPEREPRRLADAIDAEGATFRAACSNFVGELAPWHAGLRLPPAVLAGLVVGDTLIHGWDVATALDRSWAMDHDDACLAIAAAAPVLPHFVDEDAAQGFSATFEIRLRGGPAFTFQFADGALTTIEDRPRRADCRMSVDPAAFMLTAYGRVPMWSGVVRGRLAAYGRRPWLGLKLTSLLRNP